MACENKVPAGFVSGGYGMNRRDGGRKNGKERPDERNGGVEETAFLRRTYFALDDGGGA